MKRKVILIGLMMLVLVCMLAISVFADDIVVSKTESDEYGTVIQLNADPGLDNAYQYASTLNKINDTGDSTQDYAVLTDGEYYYVFPSSYIVWELDDGKLEIYAGTEGQSGLAQAMAEFNAAMDTSYYSDYTMVSSGAGRRLEALVRFEIPSDVSYAHKDYCCMRAYPKLLEVRINHSFDVTNAEKLFYQCKKLQTVLGFETVSGTMPKTVFASCVDLGYLKLPTNMTIIPGSMFQGCNSGKLNIANFSELTQLTTIDSWAFDGCQRLVITLPNSVTTLKTSAFGSAFKYAGSITINPASQLKTIGEKAFSDCGKLQEIYIPSTVTSIGKNAFDGCSSLTKIENFENCQITTILADTFKNASGLKSIKLPATVTTIQAAFTGNTNLKTVYIPASVTSIADTFTNQPADAVYIYIGTDSRVLATCTRLANATVIPFDEYVEENVYTGVNLVVGYSKCIAYNNGVHGEGEIDIVVTSFGETIKKINTCKECGMKEVVDEIPALFTCLGYSASEFNDGGIAIGFLVNKEAMAEYEKATGKTISYGVFVVSQVKLGENDIFASDGTKADGVISAEIKNHEFVAFELKLIGFTDEQKSKKLAMGAYVQLSDGNTAEYSYVQDNSKGELEGKYYFVSHNDIAPPKALN